MKVDGNWRKKRGKGKKERGGGPEESSTYPAKFELSGVLFDQDEFSRGHNGARFKPKEIDSAWTRCSVPFERMPPGRCSPGCQHIQFFAKNGEDTKANVGLRRNIISDVGRWIEWVRIILVKHGSERQGAIPLD